jgi:hypothetical protein
MDKISIEDAIEQIKKSTYIEVHDNSRLTAALSDDEILTLKKAEITFSKNSIGETVFAIELPLKRLVDAVVAKKIAEHTEELETRYNALLEARSKTYEDIFRASNGKSEAWYIHPQSESDKPKQRDPFNPETRVFLESKSKQPKE